MDTYFGIHSSDALSYVVTTSTYLRCTWCVLRCMIHCSGMTTVMNSVMDPSDT